MDEYPYKMDEHIISQLTSYTRFIYAPLILSSSKQCIISKILKYIALITNNLTL